MDEEPGHAPSYFGAEHLRETAKKGGGPRGDGGDPSSADMGMIKEIFVCENNVGSALFLSSLKAQRP